MNVVHDKVIHANPGREWDSSLAAASQQHTNSLYDVEGQEFAGR